ncbi:MAG: histidinol-phosphatase [Clostridia bacterium]|nr:histidinol-phosphatase [Clostridia bacterium]
MKKNYHTHTVRCRHADGSEREYIEKAIEAGFDTLGFSDHSPYVFRDGYYSSFRMRPEELPDYVDTLTALRGEYRDRIDVKIGLEAEFYRDNWSDYLKLIDHSGVEYLIMGQHYVNGEYPGAPYSGKADDDVSRLDAYVASVIDGARTGLYSYIAHPDMIRFTGDRGLFAKKLEMMVAEVQREGLPFEINMLGLREGRHYPSELFLSILEKRKADVILGSDAHEPRWVFHRETYERALALVDRYHLHLTEEIDTCRLKKHGLL